MGRLRTYRGFSLIELIIVIAIIAVLTAISIIGFARYQADGRDARRAASAQAIAETLEKYYDDHGEYPSCNAVTAPAVNVTGQNGALQGLSIDSLIAPSAVSGEDNSISCEDITPSTTADYFAYLGDGSADCSGSSSCLQFVLKYKHESSNTIKNIESRRKTPFDTIGAPILNSAGIDFDQIAVAWTATPNTSTYQLQVDTVSSFDSVNLQSTVVSGTSQTVSSLTPGVQYYFRVAPTLSGDVGTYSNVISPVTLELATPVNVQATSNSDTQITVTWNAVTNPNATSYTLLRSTQADMSGAVATPNITTTSRIVTGLTVGTFYYFQVVANHPKDNSAPSAIASTITSVPPPTCPATPVRNSNTQITVTWSTVSGATGYTVERATNGSFSAGVASGNTNSTSYTFSGLNNGTTYYFRVKAVIGSAESIWTNCPSMNTLVSGPSSAYWSYGGCCQVVGWQSVNWVGNNAPTYCCNWYAAHADSQGTCTGGAQFQVYVHAWYAYSSGASPNNHEYEGWSGGSGVGWWMIEGNDSWYVFFQAQGRCYINGQASSEVNLGQIGGY